MRKLLTLLAVLCLCAPVFAQTSPVTGQVRDEKGGIVPFATVRIRGSKAAVAADQDGKFKINAENGSTLVITAAGFERTEVKVSGGTVTVALKNAEAMSEVVVTALGVKRLKNSLPYAAQQINGDEISKTRSGNVASELSGKISGLQIIQGNSIGGSTNVVIRGNKSLTGNNQALFVVDGVPVDNTISKTLDPGTRGNMQATGRGGYDYGNSASDINPDDIESIEVLSPAQAVRYGPNAANGVLILRTRDPHRGALRWRGCFASTAR